MWSFVVRPVNEGCSQTEKKQTEKGWGEKRASLQVGSVMEGPVANVSENNLPLWPAAACTKGWLEQGQCPS